MAKRRVQKKRSTKAKQETAFNMESPLKAYKTLEKEIHRAWKQLRKDCKRRDRTAILKDRDNLLLLLGECDYMAREWKRVIQKPW